MHHPSDSASAKHRLTQAAVAAKQIEVVGAAPVDLVHRHEVLCRLGKGVVLKYLVRSGPTECCPRQGSRQEHAPGAGGWAQKRWALSG